MPNTDPPGKPSSSPFVKPFLYALNRMQERESLRPEQLEERARALLNERFGPSEKQPHVRFASGCAGLMSEHTHFFDGFALMMPLPMGTAVAVRPASGSDSCVAFEGSRNLNLTLRFASNRAYVEPSDDPLRIQLVQALIRQIPSPPAPVEVAIVTTTSEQRTDSNLTALAVALAHALAGAFPESFFTPATVAASIGQCAHRPFSSAYPLAVWEGEPGAFMLVDTGTQERLPVDAPERDVMGWGLVQTSCPAAHDPAFYLSRQKKAEQALQRLNERGFADLTSFRTLEHRDLQQALAVLPAKARPLVRYLVGENRRVQKLVAAIRRKDWQMFGALLLMSHASKRCDLELSCPEADFVVELVEQMLIEGMYGASLTGWGGSVLIAGQPYSIPHGLDQIRAGTMQRFGDTPEVMLL
ncbi:MAG TPA: galactokinase family protein [Rhodothermales bacterium]|nr:galactokinase family protein [Rhodothermales bacterium]